MQGERERELERERETARQRDHERLLERQREWEQRMNIEETERRQREERRLAEEIASMRRDFFAQQRTIMAQVEEQLTRLRVAAVAYASSPPQQGASPPAAAQAQSPSPLGGVVDVRASMPNRSTLLYPDGSVQPAARASREAARLSPSPPPAGQSGGVVGDADADGGAGGSLTAGIWAGEGERPPEEIDQLLEEFLGQGD